MTTISALINSFVGGELSRHLDGRTDHEKYYHGLRRLENFVPRVQGSCFRRPGFYFVREVKDSSDATVLIPFNYNDSDDESYIIELGDGYCRFYYQRAVVLSGGVPYELVTPWTSSQVGEVQYVQLGDLMYLVHSDVTWRSLTRSGHTSWTIAEVDHKDGPWKESESGDSDIVITPAARTGNNVALTASSDVFTTTDDVGRLIRLGYEDPNDPDGIQWGYAEIDQVTNTTTARCDIINDFGQQYFSDPSFEVGIAGWQDKSTDPASYIQHDAANEQMDLVHGAAGYAYALYEVDVTPGIPLTLELVLSALPGGSQIRTQVGSTEGNGEVLGVQTENATGTYTYSITPQVSTIYVRIDTSGGAAGTHTFDSVSLITTSLATSEWRLGAFSVGEGYPHALCFYEERLILAKGRWLYGSKTGGKYEQFGFETPILADDAFAREVAAPKVSKIFWLVGTDVLLAGTNSTEFKIVSGTEGEPLSPAEPIKARPQSFFGSRNVPALQAGGSILFLDQFGRKIRDLDYDFSTSKYQAVDITKLAEHIFTQPVQGWAYAETPERIVWGWLEDGSLIGCTYVPEEKVLAWHRHPIGGDGKIESLAVIPGETGSELWAVINRTINGSTKRYIEYMKPSFDGTNEPDARDAFYVDSGLSLDQWNTTTTNLMTLTPDVAGAWDAGDTGTLTASGGHTPFSAASVGKTYFLSDSENNECRVKVTGYTSTTVVSVSFSWAVPTSLQSVATSVWALGVTTISGLDHLEGESVEVLADGNSVGPKTVSSGTIYLDSPAAIVHAGLGYTSLLQPMRLELSVYGQTMQGKSKRIVEATVRFIDTVGGEICAGDDDDYEEINPLTGVVAGAAPDLFNGDKDILLAGGFDDDGLLTVRQTQPYPMTIVCVIPRVGDVER